MVQLFGRRVGLFPDKPIPQTLEPRGIRVGLEELIELLIGYFRKFFGFSKVLQSDLGPRPTYNVLGVVGIPRENSSTGGRYI